MMASSETKKYQAYPDYKDSESEWLGKIPKHWIASKFSFLKTVLTDYTANGSFADLKMNVTYLDEPSYARLVRLTDLRHELENPNGVWINEKAYKYLDKSALFGGEFLLANVGAYAGLFYQMPEGKGLSSLAPNMFMAKFDESIVAPRFMAYVGQSENIASQLKLAATASSAQPKLNKDDFKAVRFAYPEVREQIQIANFLDHETAKIDTLIEKQQQLIKLLKEKRQAVISHAVTKGLNKDVPMKDSGVEWLGEVPEHWKRIKLKHITRHIVDAEHKTAPYFEEGKYLVCRTTNVRDGKLRLEGGKYTNLETFIEWTRRGAPEVGDILFTREAPAGEACVYEGDVPLCLGQRMVLFKLDKKRVLPEYVLHSIYSGLADDFVKQLSQGSTVAHFNMADIQNIPLFEPSLTEQEEIVQYLRKILDKYDSLVNSAEDSVRLMLERRTALISAAVTGKLDVRHFTSENGQPENNNNKEKAEVTA